MQLIHQSGRWRVEMSINGYSMSLPLNGETQELAERHAQKLKRHWKRQLKNLYLRNDVWYCVAMIDGRRISKSLDCRTEDWATARRRARDIIRLARADKWNILAKLSSRPAGLTREATIEQCVDVFRRHACAHVRPRTANAYISSLRLVLDTQDLNIPVSRASRRAVRRYILRQIDLKGDSESTRRSIRSTLRQARSVFSRWALDDYRDAGLVVPDSIQDFLNCNGCKPAPVQYRLPDADLIQRTHEAGMALYHTDLPLFACYALTYFHALRAGEATACRWTWFDVDQTGRRWLRIEPRPGEWAGPKASSGKIPVPDDIWEKLQRVRDISPIHVLPGTSETARHRLVGRQFSAWLRSIGWTGSKTAHELRKLRGSEWYTQHGLEVAAAWLRHGDPAVTARYYADLVEHPEL